jgi:hypothetical protein
MMDDKYSKYRMKYMNAHEGFAFHHRSMISPTLPENNIEVPIPMATRAYVGEDPPNSDLPIWFLCTTEEEAAVMIANDSTYSSMYFSPPPITISRGDPFFDRRQNEQVEEQEEEKKEKQQNNKQEEEDNSNKQEQDGMIHYV